MGLDILPFKIKMDIITFNKNPAKFNPNFVMFHMVLSNNRFSVQPIGQGGLGGFYTLYLFPLWSTLNV